MITDERTPTLWKYLALIGGLATAHAHAASKSDMVLNHLDHATLIAPLREQSQPARKQTLCLALGLYYEARSESLSGQRAVGHVILNRIRASGKSICQTVWQHAQFSGTNQPLNRLIPRELSAWIAVQSHAISLATEADNTNGANMFYNVRLAHPNWAKHGAVTARYGDHVFIRL